MSKSTTPTMAQLLDKHPLLRRLSGQIIWLMFEEHDVSVDNIMAFLDKMQPILHSSAELIEAIASGEELYARISLSKETIACDKCAAMAGKVIALHKKGAEQMLPPYGLGCPLKAEIIPPGEPVPHQIDLLDPADGSPHGELICGDWIFTHPWSKE